MPSPTLASRRRDLLKKLCMYKPASFVTGFPLLWMHNLPVLGRSLSVCGKATLQTAVILWRSVWLHQYICRYIVAALSFWVRNSILGHKSESTMQLQYLLTHADSSDIHGKGVCVLWKQISQISATSWAYGTTTELEHHPVVRNSRPCHMVGHRQQLLNAQVYWRPHYSAHSDNGVSLKTRVECG